WELSGRYHRPAAWVNAAPRGDVAGTGPADLHPPQFISRGQALRACTATVPACRERTIARHGAARNSRGEAPPGESRPPPPRARLSRRAMLPRLLEPLGAPRRDGPLGAVHGRAGQPGDPCPLSQVQDGGRLRPVSGG